MLINFTKYVTLHILLFYNSRKHTRNLLRESNSFHFKNNNTHRIIKTFSYMLLN